MTEPASAPKRESFSAGPGPRRWHIARNGERRGPLSDVELVWLAGDGALQPDDLVWRPGYIGWTPAGKIAGLLIPPDLPESGGSGSPSAGGGAGSGGGSDNVPRTPPPSPPTQSREAQPLPPRPPVDTTQAARIIETAPLQAAAALEPPPLEPPPVEEPLPIVEPLPQRFAPSDSAPDENLRALLMAMGTPTEPVENYVLRHWRGELPLKRSFWINGVALTGPVVALCAWIIFSVSDNAVHLPMWAGSGVGLPGTGHLPLWFWPTAVRLLLIPAIAMQVWCIVGIFRSACKREGLWGEVATATAVCSALCCTVFTLLMLRG
jgi:hypothetical protein